MNEQALIRRMAFLAVFQLDTRSELTDEELTTSVLHGDDPVLENASPGLSQQRTAWDLARAAFEDRKRCDDVMKNLAPEWPAYRQAAVDRVFLCLAHYELYSGRVSVAIAIDSVVELAKEFSTEKSPGFINALLDQAAKRLASKSEAREVPGAGADSQAGAAARKHAGDEAEP